ncbi:four helix bundle protein [Ichthyenterobacterium magnum]|uniref:Four helix bundle protein n=1 Tax=Ichthyenterobacterium magnum TaxID=1230530 RepID=A0A420DXJ4_9FLAO|nr:four helix bundle protein [Ichthyenterobacterium magnum]RKE98933.1 four helix bundle protein [Ichthyenterobacterium magnum]
MKEIKFSFEDLKVYQKALDFIDLTYKATNNFPKNEDYALSSQFKRASVSIALNIAEGSGDTNAQFNRFLNISNGSIKECVVCSTIAKRLNYLSEDDDYNNRLQLEELSKMTSGLQKYLKSNDKNTND